MQYRVTLRHAVSEEAAIEVEARDEREAEEIARGRAQFGLVAWTQVHHELDVNAEAK